MREWIAKAGALGVLIIILSLGTITSVKATSGSTQESTSRATAVVVKTEDELRSKLKSADEYTITLANNITVTSKMIVKGVKVLNGNNYSLVRGTVNDDDRMITVMDEGTLTLSNIKIDGRNILTDFGLVKVSEGGKLTIKEGTTLMNANAIRNGAGLVVLGKVAMSGGTITKNSAMLYGAGVSVWPTGTFSMSGGKIEGNTSSYAEGIYNEGILKISGSAAVNVNNEVYLTTGTYLTVSSWTTPTKIKLNANIYTPLTVIVKSGASNQQYFSWSSKYQSANERPLISSSADIILGQYYTIGYDCNEGKNGPEYGKKLHGVDLTLSTKVPIRTGYTFAGWFTAATGGTKLTVYKTEKDGWVYAHWTPLTCTVSFQGNGGTVSQASKTVTYDSTYGTLPIPIRPGYTFDGWYSAATGGTKYTAQSKVAITANQTLYAQWSPMVYTVSFQPNGGTVATKTKSVTYNSTYGALPIPVREGYEFLGWGESESATTYITAASKVSKTQNHTLYARWKAEKYEVNFWTNSSNYYDPITVEFDQAYGTLPTPTKEGYQFSGWYTEKTEGVECKKDSIVKIAKNHTLFAKWTASSYNVLLDLNGGKGSNPTIQVKYGEPYGELLTPVREGYSFLGWFCEETYGFRYLSTTKVTIMKDHRLYARWYPNGITVTYHANGGKVESTKETYSYDTLFGEMPVPQKAGYTFLGWYTKQEGGVQITKDSKVDMLEDITLYARWKVRSYKLTLNPNGGTVKNSSKTVVYGQKMGELETPKRSGYTFTGWYNAKTGGTKYTKESNYTVAGNLTLYARWTQIKVSKIEVSGISTTNYVNQKLNTKDIVVTATYTDGSKKKVTSGYQLNSYSTKAGSRFVTVTYGGKSCKVKCYWYNKKAMSKISLNSSTMQLYVGYSDIVKISAPYPIGQDVTYSSTDKKIATVNSNGKIMGKKAGKTTIKVVVKIGTEKKTMKLSVQVNNPKLKASYSFGEKWNQIIFTCKVTGSKQKPVWASSNTSIATIDAVTGKLTALKDGEVEISVKVGNITKKFIVIIKSKKKSIIIY